VSDALRDECAGVLAHADDSLDDLRALASRKNPTIKIVHALCTVLGSAAGRCADPIESGRLLDELRAWDRKLGTAESHSALAHALLSAHFNRNQTAAKAALLVEAAAIALAGMDERTSFTPNLTRWMYSVGWGARCEGNQAVADELLDQLRQIANCDDATDDVLEHFAGALSVAYL
jgi:hypothetical protein